MDINVYGPAQESQGISFDIFINGAFFGNTGCMTLSTFNVPTPPMMTEFSVSGTAGCAGGPNPPEWEVVGVG